jgi:hypothetical protein
VCSAYRPKGWKDNRSNDPVTFEWRNVGVGVVPCGLPRAELHSRLNLLPIRVALRETAKTPPRFSIPIACRFGRMRFTIRRERSGIWCKVYA